MQFKTPTNLAEALAAISELQHMCDGLEGHLNLMRCYLLSTPNGIQQFAIYANSIAALKDSKATGIQKAASDLLAAGLDKQLPPGTPKPPVGGKPRPELKLVK